MQRVELLVALKQQLGGAVEESQLADIYTVKQLVDAILASAASGKIRTTTRGPVRGWKAMLAEDPTDPEVRAIATPGRFWTRSSTLFLVSFRSSRATGST